MATISTSEKLEVFDDPVFDYSLVSLNEHTYKPYGSPTYSNSDEIRIPIHFQDLILDIANSYIYIEGTFKSSDATKTCYLSNNCLAFLFDEIRYEMGGEQVSIVRRPGITTALKTMVSFNPLHSKNLLTSGWGLNEECQVILDKTSHVFSGKLPLKYLMGFAEDYLKGVLNVKQELIMVLSRSYVNCYVGQVEATINVNKIEWKVRHIVPEDREKLKLLSRINKGGNNAQVNIAYRMWDLYELPALRETTSDIWALKTSTSLEKPRYLILSFINADSLDNYKKNAIDFINAGIRDIRVYLNSSVFPYERWNLDFSKKLYGPAYYAYENFQRSYYNRQDYSPLLDLEEFFQNPVFVIDSSQQADNNIKNSTVDIKIEFETRNKFAKNIKVFALVLHDAFLSYNALDGSVRTGCNFLGR